MEKQIEKTLKFRCLDTETNQWLYFTLEQLAHGEAAKVGHKLEHWGMWTGLTDKNRVDIYSEDILENIAHNKLNDYYKGKIIVIFNGKKSRFEVSKSIGCNHKDLLDNISRGFEVVGNVAQNPEMLK